jgi:phosphoribosylanthranilate isomerase
LAGLDLNSGVESAPGVKNETLLRAAFAAINAHCAA